MSLHTGSHTAGPPLLGRVNIVETKVVGELLKEGKNLRCYIKLPWK